MRNYVKGVHKTTQYTFGGFLQKSMIFFIQKWLNIDKVLIHGNLWFLCVNSPESTVCQVTGIINEQRL